MKRFFGFAVAAILFVGIIFTVNTVQAGDKVTICHFDNSSDLLGHIKEVNVQSLDEHLENHGDLINVEYQLPEYEVVDGDSCQAIIYEN